MEFFKQATLSELNLFNEEELNRYLLDLKAFTEQTGDLLFEHVFCDIINQNLRPLEEQILIFYYLLSRAFLNLSSMQLPYLLMTCQELVDNRTIKEYRRRFGEIDYIPLKERRKIILCFTDKFDAFTHSPSKLIFEQMEAFHSDFQDVQLITFNILSCDFSVPTYFPNESHKILAKTATTSYKRIYSLKDAGHVYSWTQYPKESSGIVESMFQVFQEIKQMRPRGIYFLGESTPMVSLLSRIVNTCQVATSVHLPFPVSDTLFVPSDNWLSYKQAIRNGCRAQLVNYTQSVPLSAAPSKVLSRSDFNLPEGRFVVLIASSRLDFDIEVPFLQQLLSCADLDVVLMGNFAGWLDMLKMLSENERQHLHYIGFVREYMPLFRLCDMFLISPKSMGCGVLATYALEAEMACISLNHGDAYEVAFRDTKNGTDGLACRSIQDLLAEIRDCTLSREKLENRRALGKIIYRERQRVTAYTLCAQYFNELETLETGV